MTGVYNTSFISVAIKVQRAFLSELNWLMMNEYIVINTLFLFHIPNYNVHLIVHLLLSFQIIPFQLDKYSIFNVPNPFIITTL